MSTKLIIALGYGSDNLLRSFQAKEPYMNAIAINRPSEVYKKLQKKDYFSHIQIVATVRPPSASTYTSSEMRSWSERVVSYSSLSASNINVYESLSTREVIFRLEYYNLYIDNAYEKMTDLFDSITYNGGLI